jgi:hypothetical protein
LQPALAICQAPGEARLRPDEEVAAVMLGGSIIRSKNSVQMKKTQSIIAVVLCFYFIETTINHLMLYSIECQLALPRKL